MTGICKLCQKERELKRSHIIPEFMYQNIYDADPKRFYSVSVDMDNPERSKTHIEQKGIREYLLCGECEGKLSKYEDYAAETIYGKRLKNEAYIVKSNITADGYFVYEYAGFSYPEMKLFLMSILWRLIISKTFYTSDISEEIAENLRVAIDAGDPLAFDKFGCLVQAIMYEEGQLATKFILQPYFTGENNRVLNVLIDGFMFSFYLDGAHLKAEHTDFFVKPNGTAKVVGRILFEDEALLTKVKAVNDFYKATMKAKKDTE